MSGEQPCFQLHRRPPANKKEQSTRTSSPWGEEPGAPGLPGEARQPDQDSGVLAGLLGNLTHHVQSPERLQRVQQKPATALSLE